MKMIRVLPPAVVVALTASLAASPAWSTDAAAPPTTTSPTAGAVAPTAVAAAAAPADKATIPAFDARFVLPAADAARASRPGVLSLIASAGLSCRFNGVWSDYSPALVKRNPRMNVNLTASIGCAPVANAMGDGSVRVQFGQRVMATKPLSWRTAIGPRPALPVVKFPSALKPPALNALRARIAKTPGGLPVASPGAKASCRMLSAWWGFPSDAFPAAPRLRYNVPPSSWFAVACTPVSNAAGSAAVAPANGAAVKGIAWGAFTPYNPAPAPIPAFEMTYPNAPAGAADRLSLRVTQLPTTAAAGRVSAMTDGQTASAVFSVASVYQGDGGLIVNVIGTPTAPGVGHARVELMDGQRPVAATERNWNLAPPQSTAPQLPLLMARVPAEWAAAPPRNYPLAYIALAKQAGGRPAGTVVGQGTVTRVIQAVTWTDGTTTPAVLVQAVIPNLNSGAEVFVQVNAPSPSAPPAVVPPPVVPPINPDVNVCRSRMNNQVCQSSGVAVADFTPSNSPSGNDNLGLANWWRYTLPQYWNLPDGQPVRWPTPNTPIDVWVNCPALTDQDCKDEAGRVAFAVGKVREGGGPKLQYAGIDTSTFVPTKARHTDLAKQGAITVTFTKAAATAGAGATDIFNGLGNNAEAGVGGFDWFNKNDGKGAQIAAGYVAIDSTKLPAMDKWRRQVLYMHELGHSIGLTHPDVARTLPDGTQQPALPSTGQIMDSRLDVPLPRWGNGDLAGLKLVGSQAAPYVPAPLPILTLGGVVGKTPSSATVTATVTSNSSAVVCIAYGRWTADRSTWAQLPLSVTGPVKDKTLQLTLTNLTRATSYGYRAKLMPTSDCNGPSPVLPFSEPFGFKTLS